MIIVAIKMDLKNIYERAELAFWNSAIPMMRKSRVIHLLLPKIYNAWHWASHPNRLFQMIKWTVLGIVIGFFIGLLRIIIL